MFQHHMLDLAIGAKTNSLVSRIEKSIVCWAFGVELSDKPE